MTMSLADVYYSVDGYWKGNSAISKLAEKAGVTKAEAKEWLQKQAIWQIYHLQNIFLGLTGLLISLI